MVEGAHCMTTDERGRAYVGDHKHGQLLVIDDPDPSADDESSWESRGIADLRAVMRLLRAGIS